MSSNLYRQYVQTVHVVAAFVGLLVFAYAHVVQFRTFAGVFAGATASLGVLLLSDLPERGYPRVLGRRGTLALVAWVVAFLVLWIATQRPLSGFGLAPLLAVTVWALAWLRVNGYPESLGRRRSLTTGFVGTGVVAYGSLYGATSFLAGVCAALIVGMGSWLTSPRGPVRD